jgi:hypothetical protein
LLSLSPLCAKEHCNLCATEPAVQSSGSKHSSLLEFFHIPRMHFGRHSEQVTNVIDMQITRGAMEMTEVRTQVRLVQPPK